MKFFILLVSAFLLLEMSVSFPGCKGRNPVAPAPLDTTSHKFVWYTDTLGDFLSTVNDVFCLSENDVYAVGYFYARDAQGKIADSISYNLARWNGQRWNYYRVNPLYEGHQTFAEEFAVFAFDSNNVWLSPAMSWDGTKWTPRDMNFSYGQTLKIWGPQANDIYFVGRNGSIVHWNGIDLKEMGIHTTAANWDVWGIDKTVYIATSDYDEESGHRGYVLRIDEKMNITKEVFDNNEQIAIWGTNGVWYSAGCSSIYQNRDGQWRSVLNEDACITGIRGTGLNNIYIFSQFGLIRHYNGSTFATILPRETAANFYTKAVSASGKTVFACGQLGSYAIIKRGYQQ